MKTPVDARLLDEARRFAFRFACEDCAHFVAARGERAAAHGACSLGYPPAPRADALSGHAIEIELCKSFELA